VPTRIANWRTRARADAMRRRAALLALDAGIGDELPHFAFSMHLPGSFSFASPSKRSYGFARAERRRIDPRYREKLTISTQFGFFPIGYCLSGELAGRLVYT